MLELHPSAQLQSCVCWEQGGWDWFSVKQGITVACCSRRQTYKKRKEILIPSHLTGSGAGACGGRFLWEAGTPLHGSCCKSGPGHATGRAHSINAMVCVFALSDPALGCVPEPSSHPLLCIQRWA